ncbi:MAG TPA: M48 family peptidase, partial [Acidobacteria bacterium]|nr:M48 family peptidase [Acidobacteriota bacterium]
MNIFAVIILIAILGEYLLSLASSILSLRTFSPTLPAEFRDVFDEDKYALARHYS